MDDRRARRDLNGTWRATPADDDVRRDAIGLGVDDSHWSEIEVPGHWRSNPDFVERQAIAAGLSLEF